tara:strand:- start:263 stop:460 length:198 start_codon:yes stop_codon:yes gene_type:complete
MTEEKDKNMINWINGFNTTNKKEKYQLELRIGTFTVLEIKICICEKKSCECAKFRFMICNLGFEL